MRLVGFQFCAKLPYMPIPAFYVLPLVILPWVVYYPTFPTDIQVFQALLSVLHFLLLTLNGRYVHVRLFDYRSHNWTVPKWL